METAWARDGRIILRKPGAEDYGVELGAPSDASRMQVRLVGSSHPAAPRTATRDRDQEVIWCGEFKRLQALMATAEVGVHVERAIEAGVQPVKTVILPGNVPPIEVAEARPTARSLQ